MTFEQVLLAAIAAVIVIFILVGSQRAAARRRGSNEDQFGAGGVREVASGSPGVAKTDLAPSGVVLAAGEEWTATSKDGARIEQGRPVRVVGQRGLTLIVAPEPAVPTAPAAPAAE